MEELIINEMIIENEKMEFDHNLYSRQIGAFGVETMTKLVRLRVLQLGLTGIGIETAKNLILAGPKSVAIFDPTPLVPKDLEYNFYINHEHIQSGLTRAQATIHKLAELNGYVNTTEAPFKNLEEIASDATLSHYDIVVVTDWYPIEFVKQLNARCHHLNKGFIFAVSAGLAGEIFVDFGNSHKIFDKNGEEPASVLVSMISQDGIVTTQEDKRHDLEDGDLVKFSEVVGMEQVNDHVFRVQKVLTPFTFSIGDLKHLGATPYIRNGIAEQIKEVKEVSYRTLEESLNDLEEILIDCDMDFENLDRVEFWKFLLHTFWKFISSYGYPDFFAHDQMSNFEAFLKHHLAGIKKEEAWNKFLEREVHKVFFALSPGQYSPVHSFYGGITAQEVVKYTGKFTPLNQWLVHEFYSTALKDQTYEKLAPHAADLKSHAGTRYPSHIALLGQDRFDKMKNANVFMVGAGALGCEYLKLFAMTGLGCGNGKVTVTDDDTIEVSNLNRQFLFRSKHVGQAKSETACQEVLHMNSQLKVEALKNRVSSETETIFTDDFWDNLTFIVNAVDNIKARQYIDSKAVLHMKVLFEAGTLGTKCNSQLILPNLTESYNDSQDPQEKSIPMCTMRSFPFLIEHCIEWARGKFFDLFVQPSKFLKEFFEDPAKGMENIKKEMKTNMGGVKELADNLKHFIGLLENPTPEMYVKFARDFYQYAFDDQIHELISLFPADYRDKDGNLFWVSPKRPPHVLPFDASNLDHIAFVEALVNILTQIFVPKFSHNFDKSTLQKMLAEYQPPKRKVSQSDFKPEKFTQATANNQNNELSNDDQENIKNLTAQLSAIAAKNTNLNIQEIEFEKDSDTNGHIDFISFAANFRATNYSIPNAPRHKVKLIAGRIIPAIATTTALVVGAVGIEIYKFFLQVPFSSTRNFFSTLALPLLVFSEPIPPLVQKDKEFDPILLGPIVTIPKNWNTWSRFELQGPLTLNEVIDKIREEYGFNVSSATAQGKQIWSSFSTGLNHRKNLRLEDSFKEMQIHWYPGKKYEIVSLSGETDDMVDVYCPVLKYHYGKN